METFFFACNAVLPIILLIFLGYYLRQKELYNDTFLNLEEEKTKEEVDVEAGQVDDEDSLYDEIVNFVIKSQKASASLLQRKFKIGYNKAATMIDMLEENGIIGPPTGNSKPREVLVQFSEDMEEEE